MRICYLITRSDTLGGAFVHVRDLCLSLIENSHEVIVIVGGRGPFTKDLEEHSIPYISSKYLVRPIKPYKDIIALFDIYFKVKKIKPDILSVHTAKAGWLGRIVGKILNIPTIYTPHGWSFTDGVSPKSRKVYLLAEKTLSFLNSPIIGVAQYECDIAIKNNVVRKENLFTIHNGMPDVCNNLMANPKKDPPAFCMVARFDEPKDHKAVLNVFASIKSYTWKLVFVGEGPKKNEMIEFSRKLNIYDRVSFLGERKDVAHILSTVQCFILITKWEGFPRSILEAMRVGLPVIASDVGGVSEAVIDGETGFLVPRDDMVTLIKIIRTVIENPSKRYLLGNNGRVSFISNFTFNSMYSKTFDLYNKVLNGRSIKNQ